MPVLLAPYADEEVFIPEWVTSNETFLRWAESNEAPEKGRFGFLENQLWMDYSMESLFHNFIKSAIYTTLGNWVSSRELGMLLPDGMLLSVPKLKFSTQPDGMFISHETWDRRRAFVKRNMQSHVLYGTPDMVLEVISRSSVRKDTKLLKQLYWQAKVKEYWLVDSRSDEPTLTIQRRGSKGYRAVAAEEGWVKSSVFDTSFKLETVYRAGMHRVSLLQHTQGN
jgi:Uma2 family endonuclease